MPRLSRPTHTLLGDNREQPWIADSGAMSPKTRFSVRPNQYFSIDRPSLTIRWELDSGPIAAHGIRDKETSGLLSHIDSASDTHSLNPSSGSTFIHISPPQSAITAAPVATLSSPSDPRARVRLRRNHPAGCSRPVFITPDKVPAWVFDRSVVTLQ